MSALTDEWGFLLAALLLVLTGRADLMLLIVGNLKLGGKKAYRQRSLGLTFVCTETELMKSEEDQMLGDYMPKAV